MRAIRPSALTGRDQGDGTAAQPTRYGRRGGWLRQTGWHVVLSIMSLCFTIPLLWMLSSALKENQEIFTVPVQWLPAVFRWENFVSVLSYPGYPFLQFFSNSVFYAGSVTVATVLSCALVGYGFARLRFPGRDLLFGVTLATMMIPYVVTFIPTFLLFKQLGVLGGYIPLIAPALFGEAFFIFMMRQFFRGVPKELDDAARVDGAGEFRIFWQIMLPLVRPALVVMAVFTFVWTWHDFFRPLIYLQDPDKFPLSLGLFTFRGRRLTEWHLMMAAATLMTAPLVILFAVAQKYFIQGMKMFGIKG